MGFTVRVSSDDTSPRGAQVELVAYLCGPVVGSLGGVNFSGIGGKGSTRIGADLPDNLGRVPVHRVYDFWREEEVRPSPPRFTASDG